MLRGRGAQAEHLELRAQAEHLALLLPLDPHRRLPDSFAELEFHWGADPAIAANPNLNAHPVASGAEVLTDVHPVGAEVLTAVHPVGAEVLTAVNPVGAEVQQRMAL